MELALKLIGDGTFINQPVLANGKSDFEVTEQQDGTVEIMAEVPVQEPVKDSRDARTAPDNPGGAYGGQPCQGGNRNYAGNYQNYGPYGDPSGGGHGNGAGMQENRQYQEFVPGNQGRQPAFYMGIAVVDSNRDINYEKSANISRNHSSPVGRIVSVDPSNNGDVYGVIFDRGQQEPYYYMGYELSPAPQQGNGR